MRILLVEDETALADALSYILKKNKYGVDTAYDGPAGLEMAETGLYDLLILDWMLPGLSGIDILKSLRSEGSKVPVLLLTARDSVEDKVKGLDAGADDYLIKPFATEELLARIRALGRRPGELNPIEKLSFASLSLDTLKGEVNNGNTSVRLTLKEAQLLEFLMRNPRQVISKDQILNKVWGLDSEVELNSVEIYIHFLRKKLSTIDTRVSIDTIRGIGYCLKEAADV